MKGKFTKIMAALALLVGLTIPMGMWGQTSVTWPGTTALPGTATPVANDQNVTIMVSSTNTYSNPIRIYANTTVTINANNGAKITSVAYEASSTGNYVTFAQNATVSPEVTPSVNGKIVTWTYDESANVTAFTFTPSAQTRSNGITITYITSGSTPTCATPTFSPAAGTYTQAQTVSISCATGGATIYYTTNGDEPTTSSSVYSTPINVSSNTTIKAMATAEGYDNSAVATAEYTIATMEHDGTLEDPYSVADAHIAIQANTGVTGVYVTGIVSQIVTAYNSQYGNITFDLVDEEGSSVTLRAYRCVGDEIAGVTVGDIAVVSGNLTLYGSTYEFEQNCQLVSLTHPQPATIILNPTSIDLGSSNAVNEQISQTFTVSQLNLTAGITLNLQGHGEIDVTSINMGTSATTVTWTYTPTEAGSINATITATSTGAETQTLTISGTAVAPVTGDRYEMVTEAPQDWSGCYIITGINNNNYYALTGVSNNLGTTAAVSVIGNDIESNTTTDGYQVIVSQSANGYSLYMEGDGYLSYSGSGNNLYASDSFTASTCEWTFSISNNLVTLTNVGSESRMLQFNYNNGNSRFACYTSNQVKLTLFKYTGTVVVTPSISAGNVSIESTATSGSISYNIINGVEGGVLSAANNDDWITLGTVGETIPFSCEANTGAERTATVTLTYTYNRETVEKEVTITQAAYVAPFEPALYTRATEIVSGQHYIIVGFSNGTDGNAYAMGEQKTNNRGSVLISEDANTAVVTSESVADFVIESSGENYTFNDGSGYLYAASKSSNYLKTQKINDDNGIWAISFDSQDGHAIVVAQGENTRNTMQFNYTSSNPLFSCYSEESQKPVYLYVKSDVTPSIHTLTITGYASDDTKDGFYLIASPVSVNPATVAGMTEGDFDLYYYNDAEELEWRNYKTSAFNLTPGTGYLYAKKATTENPSYEFTLTGAPYAGQPIQLIQGWNLVGNPYGQIAYITNEYYMMNPEGNDLVPGEGNAIDVMQGIFVNATEAGTMTFSTENNAKAVQQVVMNVTRNRGAAIDRAIVRFDEGQQLPKFQLFESNTKLYIPQGNSDYAIVRSAAEGEMPVNFKARENGTYTISVNTENVEMDYLHLIDNMTGNDVDLLATPSYTFEATTRDYASRFRLVFNANNNVEDNANFAYFNGSEWQISNIGEATLQVVDVMGRIVKNVALEGNATVSINEMPGVYMMRLLNGNDVKVQKVVIR